MITLEAPKQLVVLGGGLTPEGYPTQETAERAITAAYYAQEYGADKVIFSGGRGLLASGATDVLAEAEVQADIAVAHGLNPASIKALDTDSRSTFETFLNVKEYLDDELTGIVTNAYHQKRALYMARLASDIPFIGIEAMGFHTGKAKAPFNEQLLKFATWATMLNVEQGDTDKLRERNDMIVRALSKPARVSILAKVLLRNHTSVRAVKAQAQAEQPAETSL
jgi:uncharacterized SAM-binding protein YcdF (DUF218 family)